MADDITLAQLRTFVCAAKAFSFAHAAQQLDISQPSVSAQIKMLEDRLGCRLFRRRKGTTPVLTSEGVGVLEEAKLILTANDNLLKFSDRPPAKVLLRISVGTHLRENYLKQLLPQIYREHPGVEIDLQPLTVPTSSAEVTRLIEAGETELAVYSEAAVADIQPYCRPICELPTVVIAPPGTRQRLVAGECSLEDLQFIVMGRRDAPTQIALRGLHHLKLMPRLPIMFVEYIEALVQLVEDGRGIGRTMTHAVADKIAEGRLEALDLPVPPMRRIVARSPRAPEVARSIEEMLCTALSVWHLRSA